MMGDLQAVVTRVSVSLQVHCKQKYVPLALHPWHKASKPLMAVVTVVVAELVEGWAEAVGDGRSSVLGC